MNPFRINSSHSIFKSQSIVGSLSKSICLMMAMVQISVGYVSIENWEDLVTASPTSTILGKFKPYNSRDWN